MERRVLEIYRETMRDHREGALRAQSVGMEVGTRTRARNALAYAKRAARLERLWEAAEDAGLVRFSVEPDEIGWSEGDLFGDTFDVEAHASTVPGGARTIRAQHRRALRMIERDGICSYVGYYRLHPEDRWNVGDSVGGIEGCDEIPELALEVRAETLEALRAALRSRCPTCRLPRSAHRKPGRE